MFKHCLAPALAAALCGLLTAPPAEAQDRGSLGFARLFTNDALGDGNDRWRTGSYSVSLLRGTSWDGSLPGAPGEILEYRLRGEIIAPADLHSPAAGDRRFAGVLAVGMFSHFALGQAEASFGVELAATGPQTGVGRFQRLVHQMLGMPKPRVLGNQIANGWQPTAEAEIGRSFHFGDAVTLRPFAEAQIGGENLLRVGGDLTIGSFGAGSLMVRDTVTGQRVEGIAGTAGQGVSVTMGGDVARVFDSAYLPAGGAAQLADNRSRLRLGLNWQGEKSAVFYGLTLLGKEFTSQPDQQLVGSVRLSLHF